MALDYQPLYVLGSGMLLEDRKLEVTANNLANASTPSFKKDFLSAEAFYTPNGNKIEGDSPLNPSNNYVYPIIESIKTDFSEGPIKKTGNPLDVAIDGSGFFAVKDGKGNIFYERRGDFKLDSEGYITNYMGMRVLSKSGSFIQVPPNATSVFISKDGGVYIEQQGNNGIPVQIGDIGVFDVNNAKKAGNDLYTSENNNLLPVQNVNLIDGALEESNVNPIKEVVHLIDLSRAYQVFSNLVKGIEGVQTKVSENFG